MTTDNEPVKRPRGRPRKPTPEGTPEPKRMGRPPLGENRKTEYIGVRLTKADHQLWTSLAKEQGIPLVDFITNAVRLSLKGKKGQG